MNKLNGEKVFIEQPLASPGSAKNVLGIQKMEEKTSRKKVSTKSVQKFFHKKCTQKWPQKVSTKSVQKSV